MSRACVYCGLEVRPSWWGQPIENEDPYCCYGCRFAHAVSQESRGNSQITLTLVRLAISIFFAMNVMAFTMALWSEHIYGPETESALSPVFHSVFRYLCLLFSMPVLLLLGGPLAADAWAGLKRGAPTTDLLLLTGVAASFAISIRSIWRDAGPIYFEVGVVVLVLVTLGRWLEATGKQKATQALEEMTKLIPDTARRWQDGGEQLIESSAIAIGNVLRVLAGERLPCDGRIVKNQAAVDEQIVSGESTPKNKQPGDMIWGGSLVLDGELFIESTALAKGGLIGRMIESIRTATLQKGHYQQLADRLSAVFLPMVALITMAAAVYYGWKLGIDEGILRGLAIVVIACPCAMGVATPLAVWVAVGRLAQHGILVKSGATLERLVDVRTVLFDKTGTLTLGTTEIAELIVDNDADHQLVVDNAIQMTSGSMHPHAQAIHQWARLLAPEMSIQPNRVRTVPGRGLVMESGDGLATYLGSLQFLASSGCSLPKALEWSHGQDNPVVAIGWAKRIRGIFILRENLRDDVGPVIAKLRDQGRITELLSGDAPASVKRIGHELGIKASGGMLPDDKVNHLRNRQQSGKVAMVGDGINDGPVLAAADVGIALGSGVELARETADVCLLGNDLSTLPRLFEFAERTVGIIRQNLFWALAYNILGIAAAWFGWLNPVMAAVAMLLSSLIVVSNSLRLNRGSFEETPFDIVKPIRVSS